VQLRRGIGIDVWCRLPRSGLHRPQLKRVIVMLDSLMIAYGVGFFIVAILYVTACEKM
jgi:hypothetical protein